MTVRPIVFAGPSVREPVNSGFRWRPPAAAGDLLDLANEQPTVVALIDGVFETCASVQHKEVLELIARGFVVLGAASMGALRAAELHIHGMIGIGAIYVAFASGRLTADDEVALLHAPDGFGHHALTEALVDMRATLAVAARAGVISLAEARIVRSMALGRYWKDRTWPAILDDSASALDAAALSRLRAWLPNGRVSLKARDAEACLVAASAIAITFSKTSRRAPPRTAFFRELAALRGVVLDEPM